MTETEVPDERRVLASRLRDARRTLGLTQTDVAEAVGICRSGIAAIEAADRNVSGLEVCRLAKLYRRDVRWLLGEVDDEPPDAALTRAVSGLDPADRATVMRFAQFLAAQAGAQR